MTTDVLCVNLPKFEANVIPSALAVLQGIAVVHSITCQVIDFNLDWVDACRAQNIDRRDALTGINWDAAPSAPLAHLIDHLIAKWTQQIIAVSPRVLAISVFTYYGQYFAHQLCREIKKINTSMIIVIGGQGIKNGILNAPVFAEKLLDLKLIDQYLSGNAESSWLGFLNKTFDLGLADIGDIFLDSHYVSDYSGFEFDRYQHNAEYFADNYVDKKIIVGFAGSEGCVRACDFCEIHRYSGFRQRSAEYIADNVMAVLQHANNCHFELTDSLVNGNLKEFGRILDQFIEIKKSYPEFSWSGQFIVRSAQQHPESFWRKIAASGATILYLGVETGSDRLRFAMNKRFTNADLDHTLTMLSQYQVKCAFLQFIGHPEETAEDFEHTLDMYVRYQKYAGNTLSLVQLNWMMCIYENTPLYDKADQLGLKFTSDPGLWFSTANPSLTVEARVRRRLVLSEHLDHLGYQKAYDDHVQLSEMVRAYSKYKHAIKIINRT